MMMIAGIMIPIVIGALGSISKSARTWKCTIISHSWNCSPVAESVLSLSYRELLRHNKHYPVEHPTTGEN